MGQKPIMIRSLRFSSAISVSNRICTAHLDTLFFSLSGRLIEETCPCLLENIALTLLVWKYPFWLGVHTVISVIRHVTWPTLL